MVSNVIIMNYLNPNIKVFINPCNY